MLSWRLWVINPVPRDWPLLVTMARAQAFASAMVGLRGATVQDLGFYQAFIRDWQLV